MGNVESYSSFYSTVDCKNSNPEFNNEFSCPDAKSVSGECSCGSRCLERCGF